MATAPTSSLFSTPTAVAPDQLRSSNDNEEQKQQQQQQQQQRQKKQMLEEKAERLFGYSLSTPNLNIRHHSWSPVSPPPQPQQQQYPQKSIRKAQEKYCLSAFILDIHSPQVASLLQDNRLEDNTLWVDAGIEMVHDQRMNDDDYM